MTRDFSKPFWKWFWLRLEWQILVQIAQIIGQMERKDLEVYYLVQQHEREYLSGDLGSVHADSGQQHLISPNPFVPSHSPHREHETPGRNPRTKSWCLKSPVFHVTDNALLYTSGQCCMLVWFVQILFEIFQKMLVEGNQLAFPPLPRPTPSLGLGMRTPQKY